MRCLCVLPKFCLVRSCSHLWYPRPQGKTLNCCLGCTQGCCSEEVQYGGHAGWVGPVKVLDLWALLGHVNSQYIWMFRCKSVNTQKVSSSILNQWVKYPSHLLSWALQPTIKVTFHSLLAGCCEGRLFDTQGAASSFCSVLVYSLDSKTKLTVEVIDIVF